MGIVSGTYHNIILFINVRQININININIYFIIWFKCESVKQPLIFILCIYFNLFYCK